MVDVIVTMTNLYATQHGKPTFSVFANEIRGILTCLLISGYVSLDAVVLLPSRWSFWENTDDVHNSVVASVMSVFEEILCFLHFADNKNLPAADKMAKIHTVYYDNLPCPVLQPIGHDEPVEQGWVRPALQSRQRFGGEAPCCNGTPVRR